MIPVRAEPGRLRRAQQAVHGDCPDPHPSPSHLVSRLAFKLSDLGKSKASNAPEAASDSCSRRTALIVLALGLQIYAKLSLATTLQRASGAILAAAIPSGFL